MKRWLIILLLAVATPARASNLWDNILSSTRATDWTKAGVKGGIPSASWTQCGSTIAAYGTSGSPASPATINNALSGVSPYNCTGFGTSANPYVIQLGAGTFYLSGPIWLNKSNVVLRGMGADQTFLVITAYDTNNVCSNSLIVVCTAWNWPPTTTSWTAGYSQGTTQITLTDTSALHVGDSFALEQQDDTSDGGDIYVCQQSGLPACSQMGGGGGGMPSGRAESEWHEVSAINGNNVTLNTPIRGPNWRSSQNPEAAIFNVSSMISYSGLENLSLDWSSASDFNSQNYQGVIILRWAHDCWIKGVRVIKTNPSPSVYTAWVLGTYDCFRCTIQDNYIYGTADKRVGIDSIEMNAVGDALVQNNIIHQTGQPIVTNGPASGSVFAYNYTVGTTNVSMMEHGAGEFMNLWEGNEAEETIHDDTHGTHFMLTWFRNFVPGIVPVGGGIITQPIFIENYMRDDNVVGNVLGSNTTQNFTDYQNTQNLANGYDAHAIYNLGWSLAGTVFDSNVLRTLMRWGNWDFKTNAVRWCGNSNDSNWTSSANCNSVSEVPSTIANFPNAIPTLGDTGATPPMGNMPASFYLSSRPSWWVFPNGTVAPWPGVGPEVTGGNISNAGGHAWLNPAANCYLKFMGGPSDGSGGPLTFNPDNCYKQTVSGPFMQGNFTEPSSATSVVTTYNQAQSAGDLNLVVVSWGGGAVTVSSVSDTNGNTYTLAVGPTSNSGAQSIYYAKNIVAAAAGANSVTVTFSASTSFPSIRVVEYKGVDISNPIDVTAANTGTSASSSSGSVTTTVDKDILVGANTVATSTSGPGTGYAQRILTGFGYILEDETASPAGSFSANAPLTASGNWIMQMVALRTVKSSRVRISGPAASSRGILAGKAIAQ